MPKNRFCSCDKEIQKIVRDLVQEGWSIEKAGKHFKLTSPDGISCSVSSTPSNKQASRGVLRDINNIKSGRIQLFKRTHMV
jgi:hypothetical protein